METKTYTIENLRNGKVACENDGTIEQLKKVLNKAFPLDNEDLTQWNIQFPNDCYYFKANNGCGYWGSSSSNHNDLPTQSVKVFLKEIEKMETKELKVGDYIRGFKYKCAKDLVERMINHVGDVGKIIQKQENVVKVEFKDNSTWWYPNYLAIEHLVEPLEDTPFHKPDFSHLREKIEKGVDIRFESKSVEDLKLESLKMEMETKELKVGDYIRGFNSKGVIYTLDDKYVGSIAKVIEVYSIDGNGLIQVEFSDGYKYHYSYSKAIEHICTQDMIDFEKALEDNHLIGIHTFETKDNINPSHYKRLPKETIERIQDNLTPEEFKGYLKGNILKYLDRYENKNGVEDLNKANWYLNKLIEIENEKKK